jgi:hypothetical protein
MVLEAANPCKWGFLWIILVLLVGLRARYLRRPAIGLPLVLLAAQLGAASLFMVLSGLAMTRHSRLNMRRVLIHVAPVATLVIGPLAAASDPTQASSPEVPRPPKQMLSGAS